MRIIDGGTGSGGAGIASLSMTENEFRFFSRFIHTSSGIKMPASKKTMLETRLRKRLRGLDMESFRDYRDYLFSAEGMARELTQMLDAVTTNKTDFFREPSHFAYLTERVLPGLTRAGNGKVSIWSAGCSSGEEPYTLAMVLSEYAREYPLSRFSILATDICTRMLEKARLAVYDEGQIAPIPQELRRRYLLKSRDRERKTVRVAPELRAMVQFRRLNFMDEEFGIREPLDVIFCRNVLIYFDRSDQEKLLNKLRRNLTPGGYLFLGHSETINGLDVPLEQVSSTVYRNRAI